MRLRSSTSYGEPVHSVELPKKSKRTYATPCPPSSTEEQWNVVYAFMTDKKALPQWFNVEYASQLPEDIRTKWFTRLFCMCFDQGFVGYRERRYNQIIRLCVDSRTIVSLEIIAQTIVDLDVTFDEVSRRFKRFCISFVDADDTETLDVYHHYTSRFIDSRRPDFQGSIFYLMGFLYNGIPFPPQQVDYLLSHINLFNAYMIEARPEWLPVLIPEYMYNLSEMNPIQVYKSYNTFRGAHLFNDIKQLLEKGVIDDQYCFDVHFHRLTYGFPQLFKEYPTIGYIIQNQNYHPITQVCKNLDVLSLFYTSPSPKEHKYQLCTAMIPVFVQTLEELKTKIICPYEPYYDSYDRLFQQGHLNREEIIHRTLQTLQEMVQDLLVLDLTYHLQRLYLLQEEIRKELFPEIAQLTSELFAERQLSRIINAYL